MQKFCHSCGMPLAGPEADKAKGDYCQYCADARGNLKSRDEVRQGLAQYLAGIKPEEKDVDYLKRADAYMQAMPAWADK